MKLVSDSVTRALGSKVLTFKKNSPHIFFAAGVVGAVGSTFLACRATLKLEATVDKIKTDVDAVKHLNEVSKKEGTDYQNHEYYKDLGYVYGRSINSIGRLYGPSVILGVASIGALTGSHVQLTRRNSGLTMALAAVTKAYDEYRIRIQEELGADREEEIYRNVQEVEQDIDGKPKTVKVINDGGYSPYARCFDETSLRWEKNAEINMMFLRCQQEYANHLLNARGHIFLNDVYDMLGLERTTAGQVVGWLRDGDGDTYVDFGIYADGNERFIMGNERSVWLDFNVDGVIYDKI